MSLDHKLPTPSSRFDWILQGSSLGPNESFDQDLAPYTEAAIIPTRGAFVAAWVLIVPRIPCLAMAELDLHKRARVLAIADFVSTRVSAMTDESVIFEHGPGRRGSAAGCGVDQAHLHVVGGAPDLLDQLIGRVGEVEWVAVDHAEPWATVPTGSDYLLVRDRARAVRATVGSPTPQRLRRAFADVLGRGNEWNYRSHPNEHNARRTKEMFRGAFADPIA